MNTSDFLNEYKYFQHYLSIIKSPVQPKIVKMESWLIIMGFYESFIIKKRFSI